MPQVDKKNITLNNLMRRKTSIASVISESGLCHLGVDIVTTGRGLDCHKRDQSGSIGKYVLIFLFLVIVVGYIVVQLASRESRTFRNDEKVVMSSQQDISKSNLGNEEGIGVGSVAPHFTLNNLLGKSVNLTDYRGTVVLLEFWASWCPPCNAAVPKLKNLQEKYNHTDFIVLAVAIDEGMNAGDRLLKFADEHNLNYPVLLHSEKIIQDYNVRSVPTTFIIDKQGHIVNKYIGLDENSYESMIPAQLERLLAE